MNVVNNSRDVIHSSGIVFGTSGARGLVKDFTPQVMCCFYGFICCRYAGTFFL
ncbi:phosphomannomutase [Salmonella enterica subsp. enterica]|nr:phosphomannomutase [Salmonella enterica subsp. enterica]